MGKGNREYSRGRGRYAQCGEPILMRLLETGEPCALKGASTVCAVRRVVVFLPEAGRTREIVLGLSVYLAAKAQRDKSRLSKRCMLESAVEQVIRRTRSLSVKLNCLNSNLDEVKVRTHRKSA
jgi:hypothetical protein